MGSTFAESESVSREEFALRLHAALALDLPYSERLGSGLGSVHAAVLLVFAEESRGQWSLLLTRRTEAVDRHKGQMAFPGGRCEPDEIERSDFLGTALRETEEEVGIVARDLEVIGRLPPISIVTGFQVEPFVAMHCVAIEGIELRASPSEIAEMVWVPWSDIASPGTYKKEMISRGAIRFPTHVFYHRDFRIWGATGAMIKNLLDRWRSLG